MRKECDVTRHTTNILFIGTGNMGSALIQGLIKNGYPASKLMGCDREHDHLVMLAEKFGITTSSEAPALAHKAQVIVFAVKPQQMKSAVESVKDVIIERRPLVMSVAAGIRTSQISKWLTQNCAIVRAMPNTPALIGSGATALFANARASDEERALAESIMRAVSVALWVDHEDLMDTVTALSGSGPAYFFLMMEALQQAAEELGLPTDTAKMLTIQTALGASRMALESQEELAQLRARVTSRGGTTEQAITILEQDDGLRQLFKRALYAAKKRSEELAHMFE
jgi:pyrroline-5-carboxylate reductase